MYNGYYQSPVSPGSPMIFMPYSPYPYDPIFMPPNDLPPTDVETEEKEEENETTIEVEGEKKESSANDENDENRNVSPNWNLLWQLWNIKNLVLVRKWESRHKVSNISV